MVVSSGMIQWDDTVCVCGRGRWEVVGSEGG